MIAPRPLLAAGALALALLARPAAAADDRETAAAEIFRAGASAYARRDFRAAALSFEAAFKLAPHGGTLYNAGLAWEGAGEAARAADAYLTALSTAGLEGGKATDAQARLDKLARTLGRVDVDAPAGAKASLAHAEGVATPARIHVAPGEHALRVVLPDGTARTERVVARAGDVTAVTIEPPAEPPPKPEAAPAPAPPAAEPDGGWTAQRTVGWMVLGGGAVLAGAGVYLGVRTLDERDAFEASGRTDADARDRAVTFRTWTNVALVSAGVFGAAGLILILTAPSGDAPAEPSPAARLELRVLPAGAALSGRF